MIWIDEEEMGQTTMEVREVDKQVDFAVQPFLVAGRLDKEALLEMAGELLRAEQQTEAAERPPRQYPVRLKQSWKEKVNLQRERARAEMLGGEVANLQALSARLGLHRSTAKKLRDSYFVTGSIPAFEYNHQHPPETAAEVVQMVESPEGRYFSAGEVKRRMPELSRKFIRRCLRQGGLRYRRIRHTKKKREFYKPEVCRVLSTCLPAFDRDEESLLFLDEVIFPYNHTPLYCWRDPREPLEGYKERTADGARLTAIALCSKKRMIAIQIYSGDMDGYGLVYFLTKVLRRVELPERVVVLLDNAKYHTSKLVMKSSVGRYLLGSVAKCYELNLIEVCFSKIKNMWKRRTVAASEEQEVLQIIRIFRECQVPKDYAGYRRHYLRNAQQMLQNATE